MTIYGIALAAFLAGDIMDFATTLRSPLHEQNPIVWQTIVQQSIVSIGADASEWYLTRKLWRCGHKRAAITVLVLGAGAHTVAAIHNIRGR